MIDVNKEYCPQNHNCPVISACPMGAIVQDSPFDAPRIDKEKCTECGLCSRYCPVFQEKN